MNYKKSCIKKKDIYYGGFRSLDVVWPGWNLFYLKKDNKKIEVIRGRNFQFESWPQHTFTFDRFKKLFFIKEFSIKEKLEIALKNL